LDSDEAGRKAGQHDAKCALRVDRAAGGRAPGDTRAGASGARRPRGRAAQGDGGAGGRGRRGGHGPGHAPAHDPPSGQARPAEPRHGHRARGGHRHRRAAPGCDAAPAADPRPLPDALRPPQGEAHARRHQRLPRRHLLRDGVPHRRRGRAPARLAALGRDRPRGPRQGAGPRRRPCLRAGRERAAAARAVHLMAEPEKQDQQWALQRRLEDVFAKLGEKFGDLTGRLETQIKPTVTFDDIGGVREAKAALRGFAVSLTRPELYGQWGITSPKGLLLYGPPGTGKAKLATALATASGAIFYHLKLMNLTSKFGANTGELLQEILRIAMAEEGKAVFFLDEAEALSLEHLLPPPQAREASARLVAALCEK